MYAIRSYYGNFLVPNNKKTITAITNNSVIPKFIISTPCVETISINCVQLVTFISVEKGDVQASDNLRSFPGLLFACRICLFHLGHHLHWLDRFSHFPVPCIPEGKSAFADRITSYNVCYTKLLRTLPEHTVQKWFGRWKMPNRRRNV